jgi:hypothetical protein
MRSRHTGFAFLFLVAILAGCRPEIRKETAETATIAAKVAGMTALPGFFPLYWDARAGKMWIEIDRLDTDFLYVDSLPAGLGSNDIGLDRGQLGRERVVHFMRSGPRVLLVESNLAFRASGSEAERRAVADSFARSVVAGFEVGAEEGGRVLVEGTAFFLRDAHDVIGTLQELKQGKYALDSARSAFHLANTRNFPRNTEVEVILTFAGTEPGNWVKDVAPDPAALTVRTRHSLVQLPEPGYTSREFDPRAGFFATTFADYSAPIGEPLVRRLINRHRLQKKDPQAARSEAVEPIVYYLDPATPEPIRGALLDGARWWNEAFEAAGFIDAFRVEMLPEDADPLDVRYNVIQWVHRATRGWSYGASVSDPRTGEIIKGHVSLGSLRVRQDYLIAEGLLSPYEDGKPASPEMEAMALARLRQLSAHEIGHTLGLAHNFIASAADRASVMDYPYPFAELHADGTIDLSRAYATGMGEWDKVAVAWGYSEFASGADESAGLERILADARERGLVFLSDVDARSPATAHPQANLWDGGANAVDEFQRLLAVRRAALTRFGENAIKPGQPLATLEETLVPLYLMHRFQIDAVAKSIGGTSYTYALRGDGQVPLTPVPHAEQRRALNALLGALEPETLALPESLLNLIPPRPLGFWRHRELFAGRTAGTFDALAPAEAAANLTFATLLDPGRAARLVQQHARDALQPGLSEVLDAAIAATWERPTIEGYAGEVRRTVESVMLVRMLELASNESAAPQVRAESSAALQSLLGRLEDRATEEKDPSQLAHISYSARLISQYFHDPKRFVLPKLPEPPPGQPIGAGCDW